MAIPGYKATAVDGSGNAIGLASVTVRLASDNSLATLYVDEDKVTPLTNPFSAEADGDFEFYTFPGDYVVTLGAGSSPQTFPLRLTSAPLVFATRAELVTWATAYTANVGDVAKVGGLEWRYDGVSSAISDLPGWVPAGDIYADHFGANATPGTTDMTAAAQAAITYCNALGGGVVNFFGETYSITSLSLTQNDVKLKGQGIGLTILEVSTASDIGIDVGTFKQNVEIKDLTITRAVTGTSGGYAIRFQANVNHCHIHRVKIEGHWRGVYLTATAYSTFSESVVEECVDHGVYLEGDGATGAHQWNMFNILSQKNGGDGFKAIAVTGASQMIVGEMRGCKTALNSGKGMSFYGLSATPLQDVRLYGCFCGSDGDDEIYLDTYGKYHVIDAPFCEQSGRTATGPTLSTAASNVGCGITTTANNVHVQINGANISANSEDGMDLSGTIVQVTGGRSIDNGLAGGTHSGIKSAATDLIVTGAVSQNTGVGTSQDYGLQVNNGGTLIATGCNFENNNTAATNIISNATAAQVIACRPTSVTHQLNGGVVLGNATGGDKGDGTMNVAAGLYKNNAAYVNP